MAKTGRPKIEIDKDTFEKLCALFCTEEDIADFFDCSIDTVNRWCKRTYGLTFAEVYKKKKVKGKVSLRRWQYEAAQKGNTTMLVWLGKQELGQTERQEVEQTGNGSININVMPATKDDIDED